VKNYFKVIAKYQEHDDNTHSSLFLSDSAEKLDYCVSGITQPSRGRPMRTQSSQPISDLLAKWQCGDEEALHALLPLVYNELRRLAHHYLKMERPGHTLQSTALVHEAYVRLTQRGRVQVENRGDFFAMAAQSMRQVLVDYARTRRAAKRDLGQRITWDDAILWAKDRPPDLVALDDALTELAKLDPKQSRIVEMRFFGGLSIEETSKVLAVSPATVKREWSSARAWLHREIKRARQT
jgi:RNA polymerase sigma factor (TIGR02999 family)